MSHPWQFHTAWLWTVWGFYVSTIKWDSLTLTQLNVKLTSPAVLLSFCLCSSSSSSSVMDCIHPSSETWPLGWACVSGSKYKWCHKQARPDKLEKFATANKLYWYRHDYCSCSILSACANISTGGNIKTLLCHHLFYGICNSGAHECPWVSGGALSVQGYPVCPEYPWCSWYSGCPRCPGCPGC